MIIRITDKADLQQADLLDLSNQNIQIWKFSISDDELFERAKEYLSEEELEKSKSYKLEKDIRAYVIGHGMLRHLLGTRYGQDGKQLVFSQGPQGKPYLFGIHTADEGIFADEAIEEMETAVFFNISHAADFVVLGFSENREIGIDLEQIRRHRNSDRFLKKIFHEREYEEFQGMDAKADDVEAQREQYIFLKWTQKEAVLKAMGAGLQKEMSAFYVKKAETKGQIIVTEDGEETDWEEYEVLQEKYQEDTSSWQVFSTAFSSDLFLSIALL